MTDKRVTFYDKCFKDKEGNILLGEQANLPIIVAMISIVPALLVSGIVGQFISLISFGAFFTWAWLEIFDGTNYFRRTLGMIVMIAIFVAAFIRIRTGLSLGLS